MEINNTIKPLTYYRALKGMTQAEVAEKIGVSSNSVCYWENGRFAPTNRRLAMLADVLGISIEMLLNSLELARKGAEKKCQK